MERFQPVQMEELTGQLFAEARKQGFLVVTGDRNHCNPMTAGFVSFGVFWRKYVATLYIRPNRYTCEVLDQYPYFSLCFLGSRHQEALRYCGTVSGRDEDKGRRCGLTLCTADNGTPYFAEAELIFFCKKLYHQQLQMDGIVSDEPKPFYEKELPHRMYWGEIQTIWKRITQKS